MRLDKRSLKKMLFILKLSFVWYDFGRARLIVRMRALRSNNMDYTMSHPSSSPLRNLSIDSFVDRELGEVYMANKAEKSSGKAAVVDRGDAELVLRSEG